MATTCIAREVVDLGAEEWELECDVDWYETLFTVDANGGLVLIPRHPLPLDINKLRMHLVIDY